VVTPERFILDRIDSLVHAHPSVATIHEQSTQTVVGQTTTTHTIEVVSTDTYDRLITVTLACQEGAVSGAHYSRPDGYYKTPDPENHDA